MRRYVCVHCNKYICEMASLFNFFFLIQILSDHLFSCLYRIYRVVEIKYGDIYSPKPSFVNNILGTKKR